MHKLVSGKLSESDEGLMKLSLVICAKLAFNEMSKGGGQISQHSAQPGIRDQRVAD
jgi:hypothetical protein